MKGHIPVMFIAMMLSSCVSTVVPVQTETPAPIPIQTATPIQTVSPTAEISERIEFSMSSPDGTMEIQTKDWLTFDILEGNGNKVLWSFTYDRAKFGEGHMYLYEAGYSPFYWTQDGKYIYVFARQGWDGGVKYFGDVFGAEEGVARFDTDTGTMSEVLPERYGGGYTFAISPDENSIVYVDQRETPLVLRRKDVTTSAEDVLLIFNENILDVGDYGWSPQGDKLIFQTMGPNENNFLLLDWESLQTQIIIHDFKDAVNFEFWEEPSQVYYADWRKTIWKLDLESETINVMGTATPGP